MIGRLTLGAFALPLLVTACGLFEDDVFIAHTVGEPENRDIAVVRGNGEERQVVLGGETDDFNPTWSPAHDRLAFLSRRDGNTEVYLSRADGSNVQRITNTVVDESQVTWSPDGERLAYTSPDGNGRPRIFWLQIADLLPNPLVFGSDSEGDPAWSPNGTWIAFAALAEDGRSTGLILRNPDGVIQFQITEAPDRNPVWSPDGSHLAFVRTGGTIDNSATGEAAAGRNDDIFVVAIDDDGRASDLRQVTESEARDYAAEWSPNGERVAFISTRNGATDIFTASRKGGDAREITRSEIQEVSVAWGPDGRIVFESRPGDHSELFVDDDGDQKRVSAGGTASSQPDW
jgi:TolB protein